jgi:thiamine-monophosphate kinase
MKEFDYIDWIRSQSKFDPAAVPVGPGDDCAVVALGSERLLVTVDQVLDGVHFVLAEHGPAATGRKAMARNLSDVAAMAAEPLAAVASVAMPADMDESQARLLYTGMTEMGARFNCPIVGGDVSIWKGPLTLSVTVFARPGGIEPVLRSGARPGDAVFVTGRLGGAWAGRRHLEFTPRVVEARALAGRYRPTAMIDLSDGLAGDLRHVCKASGAGAKIDAPAVPIHRDANLSRPGEPLLAALCDGEDYELLFTLAPADARRLIDEGGMDGLARRIGVITAELDVLLVASAGSAQPMPSESWEHHA